VELQEGMSMKKTTSAWISAVVLTVIVYTSYTGFLKAHRQTRAIIQAGFINACDTGSVDDMRKLLAAGADVNSEDRGFLPLQAAVNFCSAEKVDLLLQKGANANGRAFPNGDTALMISVESCLDTNVPKRLIAAGADVNAKGGKVFGSGQEHTPLMVLAQGVGKEKIAIARLLVDAGAQVDLTNDDGDTALILTAKKMSQGLGLIEMFDFLVSRGANVNARNHAGETPMKVVKSGEILKSDPQGYTALIRHMQKAGAHD
jgi:ankyrin repeat protein